MRSASHETLVAYLREHGESHTLKALRLSLLSQGYAATAVEAACRSYLAENPKTYEEILTVRWSIRIFSLAVLAVVALLGLGVLLVGGCTDGYVRIMNGAVDHFNGDMKVALNLYFVLLVVFAGIVATVWYATGPRRPRKRS